MTDHWHDASKVTLSCPQQCWVHIIFWGCLDHDLAPGRFVLFCGQVATCCRAEGSEIWSMPAFAMQRPIWLHEFLSQWLSLQIWDCLRPIALVVSWCIRTPFGCSRTVQVRLAVGWVINRTTTRLMLHPGSICLQKKYAILGANIQLHHLMRVSLNTQDYTKHTSYWSFADDS